MPWYKKLSEALEPFAEMVLIGIVLVSVLILWKGDKYSRVLWATYLVSP